MRRRGPVVDANQRACPTTPSADTVATVGVGYVVLIYMKMALAATGSGARRRRLSPAPQRHGVPCRHGRVGCRARQGGALAGGRIEAGMDLKQKIVCVCAVATLAAGALAGCTSRKPVTYQSDFKYLWPGEVRNSMGRLADHIRRLDTLLGGGSVGPEQRERIIDNLRAMENIADSLGAGPEVTNHAFIDDHIDDFRADVRLAREEVEREPPAYYLAGRLAGSCTGCHVLR